MRRLSAFSPNALNPAAATETKEIIAAASSVGQPLQVLAAATETAIAAAFDNLANHQVGGLLVNTDPFFLNHRAQIIGLKVAIDCLGCTPYTRVDDGRRLD